jgi:outer membrane receptor for ferrienterochelin and colicins
VLIPISFIPPVPFLANFRDMTTALLLLAAMLQAQATLLVTVVSGAVPVPQAEVSVGDVLVVADESGVAELTVAAGDVTVVVSRFGFGVQSITVPVAAGAHTRLLFILEAESVREEELIVTATRSDRRIEEVPIRVEVVPSEEVQEKIMMTPGDISMLLAETNGLRLQTTSPSLGGASVRIQGLRGRYTQTLADGLPLFGSTGSIGLLQIPPMDLGQVEVIKGVASALYGASAVGGVVNLVSRRPQPDVTEREVLLNTTSHGGTDAVLWLSAPLNERWGATFVGGAHGQTRSDLDSDGWTDLPMYRRFVARPRVFWENGRGGSLLVTAGVMTERRRGGTEAGAVLPDGQPFPEQVNTDRFDGGLVGRWLVAGDRLVSVRGSATSQQHAHLFGPIAEPDRHRTWFGETSISGTTGGHTWVSGVALQQDAYRSRRVSRFDYTFTVPGVFIQDEYDPVDWLSLSASARLDAHSDYGTFFSPRLSALVQWGGPWQTRVSVGRGFFAPTPFTEETDATGLSRIAPLGDLVAERAESGSLDVTWAQEPLELTVTLFYSRVQDALQVVEIDPVEAGATGYAVRIINGSGPTRTRGAEFVARANVEGLDVIVTYMFLESTEADPLFAGTPARRTAPLNPRHAASLDILWETGPARVGFEVFYTGEQALDENPYRTTSRPYLLWGGLLDWRLNERARLFVNVENISDIRQTNYDRLTRPFRNHDGQWTVDAWAPLEGRTLNAGIRWEL